MKKGISPKWGLLGASVVAAVYNSRISEEIKTLEHLLYIIALLILIGLSVHGMLNNRKKEEKRNNKVLRMVKVSFASFGIAWGAMLLFSVVFLPLLGYSVMELIVGPWSLPILVACAILVLPYVERKLQ